MRKFMVLDKNWADWGSAGSTDNLKTAIDFIRKQKNPNKYSVIQVKQVKLPKFKYEKAKPDGKGFIEKLKKVI